MSKRHAAMAMVALTAVGSAVAGSGTGMVEGAAAPSTSSNSDSSTSSSTTTSQPSTEPPGCPDGGSTTTTTVAPGDTAPATCPTEPPATEVPTTEVPTSVATTAPASDPSTSVAPESSSTAAPVVESTTVAPEAPPSSDTIPDTAPSVDDAGTVDSDATAERQPESPVVEESTTTVPTTDTTVADLPAPPAVSLPPVNPVWLQTGNRRSTAGASGASPPEAGRTPVGVRLAPVDEIDVILATIRQLESGSRYDIGPNKASASGAYQYIHSTWNGYAGYSDAYLAPQSVQDERARGDVERILVRFGGDVTMVPVMWYYPRAAIDTTWMDRVPNPAGGNRLTVREYQTRWVDTYRANYEAYAQYFQPSTDPGHVAVVAVDQPELDWLQLQRAALTRALGGLADEALLLTGADPVEPALSAPLDPAAAATLDPAGQAYVQAIAAQEAAKRSARAQRNLGPQALAGQTLPTTTTTTTTTTTVAGTATTTAAVPDTSAADALESASTVAATAPPTSAGPATTTTTVPPPPPFVADDGSMTDAGLALAERSAIPSDVASTDTLRSLVFPVLGPVTYADGWGDCRDNCNRRHVGTDIIGVQMQPLLAAVDGAITRVSPDPTGISGVAISITGTDGWRYNYFHANNDTPGTDDGMALDAWEIAPGLKIGSPVVAGQIIGYMGNSGNAEASTTHLHFEIRDPTGLAQPSYAALRAAEARQACTIGIGPWSTPQLADGTDLRAAITEPQHLRLGRTATGQLIDLDSGLPVDEAVGGSVVEHTVVKPLFGNGQWIIDTDGRVTATGDAALIIPSQDMACDPGPLEPFGTDAAGWRTTPDAAVLAGSTLAEVDLTGTILDGVLPAAPDPAPTLVVDPATGRPAIPLTAETTTTTSTVPVTTLPATSDPATTSSTTTTPPAAAGAVPPAAEVHSFQMPSTGEVILLVFPALPPAQPVVGLDPVVNTPLSAPAADVE